VALYTEASPLAADSPYHAFARSPATALFGRPQLWPGPEAAATTARLLWNEAALFVCWELEGEAAPPIDAARVDSATLHGLEGGRLRPEQRTVLLDERVECFLWQPPEGDPAVGGPCTGQTYYAFEINHEGRALTNRAKFGGPFDYGWSSDEAYAVWTREMAVGWGTSSSPVPSAVKGHGPPHKRVVIAELRWGAMGLDPKREVRVGLHRAQHAPGTAPDRLEKEDRLLAGMIWSSWVDPGDEEVNFHRPAFFGGLALEERGSPLDCSCCAARLLSSRALRVLPSPKPLLEECPPGSLVVRAKYSSVCGSDIPYFRNMTSKAPSCYWDRDGFCGHEALGFVVESKSPRFQPGDPVMALPSSYFKAHAGSRQEWYREDVHGVLLQSFPVRGGFSQVYTSHELYSYKLKACEPPLLLAQGLGTLLRLARRLGPVLGKTVAIVGQGQNGLMASRLMAQLCAKHVVAIEPLEYRRSKALSMGATHAVAPEEAEAVLAELTSGQGADVVLEMVGHNQDTINFALELAASAGTVAAFGVPDDRIYEKFEYTLFFRKNITLIASVIPDPGTDFPEAVQLIEQGRFKTEGILTHVLPLAEVQKAFTMAADYTDGVVKLVVDLS